MEYTIKNVGNGWYCFREIPQGYIKIDNLRCGSDKKALNRAKKMINLKDTVKIVKET